jgi:hypothetical protein
MGYNNTVTLYSRERFLDPNAHQKLNSVERRSQILLCSPVDPYASNTAIGEEGRQRLIGKDQVHALIWDWLGFQRSTLPDVHFAHLRFTKSSHTDVDICLNFEFVLFCKP